MSRAAAPTHSRLTTQVALYLLLCLVWLQCVGVIHRQVHAALGVHSTTAVSTMTVFDHGEHRTKDALDAQGQPNSTACQLFDLACSGVALAYTRLLVMAMARPLAPPVAVSVSKAALLVEAYQARGPPALI
jgi:predicted neutral ceramidase superfamily lipid hydrolase